MFGDGAATTIVPGKGVDLRYPGQWVDPETFLNYNYYRDYEAGSARYVESDPFGLYGGLSTYSYSKQSTLLYFDRFGLFGENGRADQFDKIFLKEGHSCAVVAWAASSQAKTRAGESGLDGPHNGPQDAYRHCVWVCIMAKLEGLSCATTASNVHEEAGTANGQDQLEREMDEKNNQAGLEAAACQKQPCNISCKNKLDNCQLTGLSGSPICRKRRTP